MKVLAYRVGQDAEEIEIENNLSAMQEFVDGFVEILHFEDFCLICNEEGKMRGLPPNRELLSLGHRLEWIFGDFFICKVNDYGLEGLTNDDIEIFENSGIIGGMDND